MLVGTLFSSIVWRRIVAFSNATSGKPVYDPDLRIGGGIAADPRTLSHRITLFAAAAEAASNGEEQTQTSSENGPQITRSRTIEICGLEQTYV
jgi:hypothetical protein